MSVVRYKDYIGSVRFRDGRLVIRLEYINDHIEAECDSASDVEKVFHELVDEYLEDCAAFNKEPDRVFRGTFNVRVSSGLHKRLAMRALSDNTTLNSLVRAALENFVEHEPEVNRRAEIADTIGMIMEVQRAQSTGSNLEMNMKLKFDNEGIDNFIKKSLLASQRNLTH